MVKEITHYQCEICERLWPHREQAERCEASPPPALQVGDVVLWRGGRRDPQYGPFQTLVYDRVVQVEVDLAGSRSSSPGHRVDYHLGKERTISGSSVPSHAETGYLTVIGGIGRHGHHAGRLEVVLRGLPGLDDVVERLRGMGLCLHSRTAHLYTPLRDVEYSLTWSSSPRDYYLCRLAPNQAVALEFLSRPPTDDECLRFVGGQAEGHGPPEPHPYLAGAFEFNRYHTWGGVVGFDINAALALLSRASDEEIVAAVRRYRAALLRGEAAYLKRDTLAELFRIDESRARGKWPRPMLDWCKEKGVRGSGMTRLRRAHEAASGGSTEKERAMIQNHLRLWEDRHVIAVVAGKGGVGKSTIAADLARALAAAGKRTLLFDADFYGPSVPLLFPVADPRYRTTPDGKFLPHLVDGVEVVSVGHLLDEDEPLVWRGPFLESLLHLLGSNVETAAEIVILDMPPGTGDVVEAIQHLCPHTWFLFVCTAGEIALADVRRAVNVLSYEGRSRIMGVLENMAYVVDSNGERLHLWGEPTDVPGLAGKYHLRFLGTVPVGPADVRRPVVEQALMPAVEDVLAGRRFQEVALDVIVEKADELIAGYGPDASVKDAADLYRAWSVSTIANHLEATVVRLGGDPTDGRYRETLLRELRRVWKALGTHVRMGDQEIDESLWWAEVVAELEAGGEEA